MPAVTIAAAMTTHANSATSTSRRNPQCPLTTGRCASSDKNGGSVSRGEHCGSGGEMWGQLPRPACADALAEGGGCTPVRRVGLTRSKSACGAGPDASGNLIVGVLHSIPGGHRGAERRVASRSLRRTRLRGRLTATHPCRETRRGLVGTPALADCLWPVMDSRVFVAPGCEPSHALLPSLLARFGRSLRTGTPRDRLVESGRVVPETGR